MPFFASGEARERLIVLFLLKSLDMELTRTQLATLSVSNDILPWFDLQSAVAELETQGLIAAIPRPFGQGYRITPEGEETLDMFLESLPASLRARIETVVEENRDVIRKETQYATSVEKRPGGSCVVTLRAMEWDGDLLSISLLLPDQSTAQAACAAWPEKAQLIYQGLIRDLLS